MSSTLTHTRGAWGQTVVFEERTLLGLGEGDKWQP
jgi:hypothetical protein